MATKTYYGWFVLVGTFLSTLGFGLFFSFGVFYTPLLHEFGWTKAQTASVVALATAVSSFGSVGMGGLADRFGPRKVFLIGSALLGSGAALTSLSNSIWEFYLFYGVIAGLGWAIIGTVPLAVAVMWFSRRRALATGVTTSGSGMGGTAFPSISAFLIALYGWRSTLLSLGAIFAGLLLVSSLIVRRPSAEDIESREGNAGRGATVPSVEWTLKTSIRTPALWLLFSIFLLASFSLFVVFTYVPPLSLARGISPLAAAETLGLLGAAGIVARFASFGLVRSLGTIRSLTLATAGVSLGTLIPLISFSLSSLYAFAILYGASYGLWIAILPSATAEIFGRSHYGQIWGVVNAGGGIGGLVGPIFIGLFLDSGGFDLYLLPIAGAATAIATAVGLVLTRKANPRLPSRAPA